MFFVFFSKEIDVAQGGEKNVFTWIDRQEIKLLQTKKLVEGKKNKLFSQNKRQKGKGDEHSLVFAQPEKKGGKQTNKNNTTFERQ